MVGAAPTARRKMTAEILEKALGALIGGALTHYRPNAAPGDEADHRESSDTHNDDLAPGSYHELRPLQRDLNALVETGLFTEAGTAHTDPTPDLRVRSRPDGVGAGAATSYDTEL